MRSGLFKNNIVYKLFKHTHTHTHTYEQDLELNNLQVLIWHKAQPNQT